MRIATEAPAVTVLELKRADKSGTARIEVEIEPFRMRPTWKVKVAFRRFRCRDFLFVGDMTRNGEKAEAEELRRIAEVVTEEEIVEAIGQHWEKIGRFRIDFPERTNEKVSKKG